ncbi:efflux RND transporter periplasmic adaptor subunit [soil metagenome]
MAETEAQKPKRSIPIPLIILLVAGLLYGGYRYYDARKPFEWSGTVEARVVYVGSRVGGRIKEVKAKEGDSVKLGDPILILEPGDLDAQRLVAAGQLAQVQATLDKLIAGARPEEIEQARARTMNASAVLQETRAGARQEQIDAAKARLAVAQNAFDKAQLDSDRFHKLLATAAISQAEADNGDSALRGAVAQRDAAKVALTELENGTRVEEIAQASARVLEAQASAKLVSAGARVEDIRAAQGTVDAAKGKLEAIDVAIRELVVTAPVAGRIESLDLRPGTILAPNATAATILEDGQLYVRIYVPETHLGRLHIGDDVPITVDSFPGRSFPGKVEHINSVGEFTPRNLQTADERADQVFATRIQIQDGSTDLRAGMAALLVVPK